MMQKLQQLDTMTLENIKSAVEGFEKSEGEKPTVLKLNGLMSIALRESPDIVDEFKKLGNLTTTLTVSLGCLNRILEAKELPKVTIDNAVGNNIVAMS